jgi:hypothetical protein
MISESVPSLEERIGFKLSMEFSDFVDDIRYHGIVDQDNIAGETVGMSPVLLDDPTNCVDPSYSNLLFRDKDGIIHWFVVLG